MGGVKECLRFPGSAEFHPLMYLEGLAAAVERHGGKIYEGTKAWKTGKCCCCCAAALVGWWGGWLLIGLEGRQARAAAYLRRQLWLGITCVGGLA